MKTARTSLMVLAAAGCLALRVAAASIPATPADQPIVPGEWHLSLSKALAMAQETGIPVLGFGPTPGVRGVPR